MKKFLVISFLALIALNTTAQQLDPLDFSFDHKSHVLRPAEVLKNHVASCTVSEVDGQDHVVLYDGNGRVVADDFKRYFHIYDVAGNITKTHVFHFKDYVGQYNYEFDESGNLTKINKLVEGSFGTDVGEVVLEYENGRLVVARDSMASTSLFGDTGHGAIILYEYDEQGELSQTSSNTTLYSHTGDGEQEVEILDISYYNKGIMVRGIWNFIGREVTLNEDGSVQKIEDTGIISDRDEPEDYELLEAFTYYPNGLVKSKTTPNKELQYQYEYLTPAVFNLNVPEAVSQVRIYNFSQFYDMQLYNVSGGTASIELYVPFRELYMIQLWDQFMLPFIVEPGQTINLTVTETAVSFDEADHLNNFLVQIEGAKQNAYAQDPDNAVKLLTDMITETVKQYPELMVFLFYTDLWDLQNHKQLFLDYTEKVLELYPNNYKAHQAYSLLSN